MNFHDSITAPSDKNRPERLDQEWQITPSDKLVATVFAEYGLNSTEWNEVKGGIGHIVLRVKDSEQHIYYLKLYSSIHGHDKVVREADYVLRAHASGLPVPRLHATLNGNPVGSISDETGTHPFTLTTEIPGSSPTKYESSHLAQLARYHAQLHDITLPFSDTKLDINTDYHYHEINEGSRLATLANAVSATVLPTLEQWDELPSGPTHLDIMRTNILANNTDVTGIIDFEDLENAPFAFCLAGTLWDIYESEDGNLSNISQYLASYNQQRPLSPLEQVHLGNLLVLRGWIALHGSLITKGEDSEQAQTQERLLWSLLQP